MKMLKLVRGVFLAAVVLIFSNISMAQSADELTKALQKVQQQPQAIEVYYEVLDGFEEEFLELYRRNHWPVLQAEIDEGSLVAVHIDTQWFPPPGAQPWDFRVTMVFTNIMYRHEMLDRKQGEIESRLFKDSELFKKEERRRFDLVDRLYIIDRTRIETADW